MTIRICSLICGLFLLNQLTAQAADNTLSIVFALQADKAKQTRYIYSRSANGETRINQVQFPFALTLKQKSYQIERIYPIEVFRNRSLKTKFEEYLGGRLFSAKVKVSAPYKPESVYQEIGKELMRPEVLFSSQNFTVSIPENDKIEPLPDPVAGTSFAFNVQIASGDPSDPLYEQSYNLKQVQANLVWEKTHGNPLPIVAVIDTGTNLTHEDLAGSGFVNKDEIPGNGIDDDADSIVDDYDKGYSVNNGEIDNDGEDVNGHGTAIASVIGARMNGKGLVGVAPQARILPIRFLNKFGSGSYEDSFVALGLAIEIIVSKSSSAPFKGWINNSWGGGYTAQFASVFKVLFDLALENGIGISCAAGNNFGNNDQDRFLPASIDSLNNISVAASDSQNNIASYSQIGPTTVHHAAPGSDILFAVPPLASYKEKKYGKGNGTSFAAPHDAGAAILISGIFPDASVEEIVARIVFNSDRAPAFYKAFIIPGRLNIYKALIEDRVPPSDISWASPLTVYHNQASFAWQNGRDDFTDPYSQLASAVRLEIYTADQTKISTKLVSVDHEGFQKETFTDLQENTRYFPVIYNLDNVGNASRLLALAPFMTPTSKVIFEENFEKHAWQKLPDISSNLWYLTHERFFPPSSQNSSKAYRFGQVGLPNYQTGDVSQAAEGHILSPPINIQGLGGLTMELEWFMAGDFVFDFLYVFARTNLEGAILAATRNTFNQNYVFSWQNLKVYIPELHTNNFRLDIFFTTNKYRLSNETEGAYVDNIKIRASSPVIVFPDPTISP